MNKRRRRWLVIGTVGVVVVLAGYIAMGEYRGKYYASHRLYQALICVGQASLYYQTEHGVAPLAVEDLLQAGVLRRSPSGEHVELPVRYYPVLYTDAIRVTLQFPVDPDEYELCGDEVVSKVTGDPVILVDMRDAALFDEHRRQANQGLAHHWLKVVHGEPFGDW